MTDAAEKPGVNGFGATTGMHLCLFWLTDVGKKENPADY